MNHRQLTNHIRNRIKREGIDASVRGHRSCGVVWIVVEVDEPGKSFTQQQCKKIALIAFINGLTYAKGVPVDCTEAYWSLCPEGLSKFTFVDNRSCVQSFARYEWITRQPRSRRQRRDN
jgi:hypothetical protein